MVSFLDVCLRQACDQFDNATRPNSLALACAVFQKMSEWLLLIEVTPRYMSQEEADQIYKLGCEQLTLQTIGALFKILYFSQIPLSHTCSIFFGLLTLGF